MCSSCNCYIPYQANDLIYQTVQLNGPSDSYSWWIAVYNNAPDAGPNTNSSNLLQLRFVNDEREMD